MKRTVLVFGIISGVVSSLMMFLTVPLINRGTINFDNGEVIGYTAIFLSFLLVFFGIRSYRENHGGTISFGRAFAVGILITLISCVFYVASWEAPGDTGGPQSLNAAVAGSLVLYEAFLQRQRQRASS